MTKANMSRDYDPIIPSRDTALNQLPKLTDDLVGILRKNNLPEKEIEYRAERLLKAAEAQPELCEAVSSQYYNIAHEIRSLEFLSKYGSARIAMDSTSEADCDIILDNKLQIECICCSPGKSEDNGWADYLRTERQWEMRDTRIAENFILSRITNAISNKRDFYWKHIEKKSAVADRPYIVFIGLGSLHTKTLFDELGREILRVLFGTDKPTLKYDESNEKFIFDGYTYNRQLEKWNGSKIDSIIFRLKEYRFLSGIIVTVGGVGEEYSENETWLFTNPNAINCLTEDDLKGMPSWRENSKGKYVFLADDNN